MISHGEPIGHDDIFGKEWSAIGFPLQVVVLRIVVGSLKMFGPVGYSIFDDPLPSSVLFCSFCNANWANQHFGFLSQSSPDDGNMQRCTQCYRGRQPKGRTRDKGRILWRALDIVVVCGWGQKETKDIGKALFCQLLCQAEEESSTTHTVALRRAN